MWELAYPGAPAAVHYGFADFGTPGADPASFDPKTLDGVAEIVAVNGADVSLYTLSGQLLFTARQGGGPPTIGDFDNDGFPEISSAGSSAYTVFDLDCEDPMAPGCTAAYVRWTQPSQDASSKNTGSSIFDFEGDGEAEAIYADECFLRVYQGSTGEVLYSAFRTDNDQNTEILVGPPSPLPASTHASAPRSYARSATGLARLRSGPRSFAPLTPLTVSASTSPAPTEFATACAVQRRADNTRRRQQR